VTGVEVVEVVVVGSSTKGRVLLAREVSSACAVEKQKNIKDISFSPESWVNQKNVNFNIILKINGD